ncbi:hypothetical protein PRZ48_000335 [Zasmidium cellare]|uniref:Gfd2/YDR514C-like C-terminal domain-containing protein n=1 Tax=Zasmidium cellare TaxID=395010 RepID=A0ABR0F0K1_ZASCE|nr:hypothetical protein PRZ48_000335 [Zasmidium cellare]
MSQLQGTPDGSERQIPPAGIPLLQQVLGLTPRQDDRKHLQNVVFVCIDCEAFEFGPEKVMEVGVSVLDTSKIDLIDPEITSQDLISHIESAHYRIEEYGHLRNKRWVKGNPDAFAFGSSTWVKKADAKKVLLRIFQDAGNLSNAATLNEPLKGEVRNVVLVGHGIKNEVDYLKRLDFPLAAPRNIVHKLDTSTILSTKKQQVALKNLLQMTGINVDKSHLHNAGNDAAYTLHALMTIATREHAVPGCLVNVLAEQRAEGAAQKTKKAKQRAKKKKAQNEAKAAVAAANPGSKAAEQLGKEQQAGQAKKQAKILRRRAEREERKRQEQVGSNGNP